MRKTLVLLILVVLGFMAVTNAAAEETEWYFEIIKFDNGGNSCGNGEGLIFFPGTLENLKSGQRYPMCRKLGNEYVQVAWAIVQWVDLWESKVKIEMLEQFPRLLITDKVRMKVDLAKGYKFWWEKGVEWEKQKNYYDAFRAYYRAKLYLPSNMEVDAAYRRTGYHDYLTQGLAAMKAKKYMSAISLFKLALQFPWPGGSMQEAIDNIKKCEELLGMEEVSDTPMAKVEIAVSSKDYRKALEECRSLWLSYAMPYGTEEEQKVLKRIASTAWGKLWRDVSGDVGRLINSKKNAAAYREMYSLMKLMAFADDRDDAAFYKLFGRVWEKLPTDSLENRIHASLFHLAALQSPDGYFTTTSGAPLDDNAAFFTGLALAAFAASGNTTRTGPYREVVSKAYEWILSNRKPNGALYNENNLHAHIALVYGLSELLIAGGNDDVHGNVFGGLRFMCLKQSPTGSFAPRGTADNYIDNALAAITLANGLTTGIFLTAQVYDDLRNYAYGNVKGTDGSVVGANGANITQGSEDDVYAVGALLAIIRGTGGNMYGAQGMPLIRKAIGLTPDISRNTPAGYYFTAWAMSIFPPEEWLEFQKGIVDAIAVKLGTESLDFPSPESPVYQGVPGAAAFALLAANSVYISAFPVEKKK